MTGAVASGLMSWVCAGRVASWPPARATAAARVAAAAGGHQFGELRREISGQPGMAVVSAEWRLVQHELADRQAGGGGLEREGGAGGVAEHGGGPAGRCDQRGEVVDLPVDRVG